MAEQTSTTLVLLHGVVAVVCGVGGGECVARPGVLALVVKAGVHVVRGGVLHGAHPHVLVLGV